jgi:hypothetical protein
VDVFSFGDDVCREFYISQFGFCDEQSVEVIELGFDDKEA